MKHKIEFDIASRNKFERLLKVKQQFIQKKEGIGDIDKQYSKAISMLILQEYYKLDDNTAYDSLTDNPDDKDIDALYYDESSDDYTLTLIQAKYKKTYGATGTFEEKDIKALIDTAKNIMLGEKIDTTNSDLLKSLEKYKKFLKDNNNPSIKIILFYATNGIIHDKHKHIKEVKDANRYGISCCNFIDVNHFITKQKPYETKLKINKKVQDSKENFTDMIFCSKGFLCSTSLENFMNFYSKSGQTLLLNENVRFLIEKSQINKEILKSFSEAPEKFCFLNNGIYIVCDKAIVGLTTESFSNLILYNPSIINGGQTTAILYALYGDSQYSVNFKKASVFIRIYELDSKFLTNYEITKATNSQNKIDIVDLEANNKFQIQVKNFFSRKGVGLLVKEGEDTIDYVDTIANETLLQAYVAIYDDIPDLAKRSKRTVFKQCMHKVFNEKMLEEGISEKLYRCYEIHKLLQERKPTKKENPDLKSFMENAWYSLMYTMVKIDDKMLKLSIDYANLKKIFNKAYSKSEVIIQEIVRKRSEELKERFSMNNLFKSKDIKDLIDLQLTK